jgi:hypothetical protein
MLIKMVPCLLKVRLFFPFAFSNVARYWFLLLFFSFKGNICIRFLEVTEAKDVYGFLREKMGLRLQEYFFEWGPYGRRHPARTVFTGL